MAGRRLAVLVLVVGLLTGCSGPAAPGTASSTPVPVMSAPQTTGGAAVSTELRQKAGPPPAGELRGPVWTAIDAAADSRDLVVQWEGVGGAAACGPVDTAWVQQSATRVVITLTRHRVESGVICPLVVALHSAFVRLDAPLGNRKLLEPAAKKGAGTSLAMSAAGTGVGSSGSADPVG